MNGTSSGTSVSVLRGSGFDSEGCEGTLGVGIGFDARF
jgi:hypothetical protein